MKKYSLKSISGIIFDMDGVIFDSEAIWKDAFQLANVKFGLQFTEEDRQSCCGKDEETIRKELKNANPYLDVDGYRDFIVAQVENTVKEFGAPLKDFFPELISFLQANHIKIALATSSKRQRARMLFQNKGLDPSKIFHGMVFGEDVETSKPNPEIFLLAAHQIGCTPASCIVLEDSLNGIEAAKCGGFNSIMVKDLIEPNEEAKKSCLLIADNLGEVLHYLQRK